MRLKPYQEKAVSELRTGSILVGGVGTGKTITSLAYYLKKHKDIPLYVITTAQKRDKHEWEMDAAYFCLEIGDRFHIDSWNNIKKYEDVKDAFFIFDEQRLVGYGAWVKAFLKIAKKNDWILLSATPGDQWTDYIPVFVANGFYKNKTEFSTRHIVYKPFTSYPIIQRYLEEGLLLKLKSQITVEMRVDRKTIRHVKDIFCEYDKSLYEKTAKDMYNYIDDKMIESEPDFRIQLRRIVNGDKSRVERVIDILKEHKSAIIFYNYNYELDILRSMCIKLRIEYSEWNGHKHEKIPIGEKWVYLVQYTAGSEGWNCISTDTIIFYSLNYSYRTMEQACGRIDRMNTPYIDLYYYYLITPKTIDDAVLRCIKRKKTFNEKRYFEEQHNFFHAL